MTRVEAGDYTRSLLLSYSAHQFHRQYAYIFLVRHRTVRDLPRPLALRCQQYTQPFRDSTNFSAQWSDILTKGSSMKFFSTSRRPFRLPGFNLSKFDSLSALRQTSFSIAIKRGVMHSSVSRAFKGQDLIALVMPMHARCWFLCCVRQHREDYAGKTPEDHFWAYTPCFAIKALAAKEFSGCLFRFPS